MNNFFIPLKNFFVDIERLTTEIDKFVKPNTWNEISYHYDEHTPYRIHIALKTSPDTIWRFKENGKITEIHQPADGIPVLIKTNSLEHSVFIPIETERVHLWYQYHHEISNEVLEKIKNV